jgi:hypothetical protein
MSKIVIQLNGGLVADVFSIGTGKVEDAIIVDYDVEGLCEKDYITAKDEEGNEQEASVHTESINELPIGSDVDLMVKTYLKTQE